MSDNVLSRTIHNSNHEKIAARPITYTRDHLMQIGNRLSQNIPPEHHDTFPEEVAHPQPRISARGQGG